MRAGWTITGDHPMSGVIDTAYRVFAGPPPESLYICTCCGLSAEQQVKLRSRPVRDYTRADLDAWFSSAAADPYPVAAWTHVLPRLLEALVFGAVHPLEPTQFLSRAPVANTYWNASQQQVLDQILHWYLTVSDWPDGITLDDVVVLFERGGWDLDDLLAQVLALPEARFLSVLTDRWLHPEAMRRAPRHSMTTFYQSKDLRARLFDIIQAHPAESAPCVRAIAICDALDQHVN
ncbi:MAG: hypothetical protein AB3N23_15400 [Paracoccaceae bacterium]